MHHSQVELRRADPLRDLILECGRLAWLRHACRHGGLCSIILGGEGAIGGRDGAAVISDVELRARGDDGRRGEANGFEAVVVLPLGVCGGDEGEDEN